MDADAWWRGVELEDGSGVSGEEVVASEVELRWWQSYWTVGEGWERDIEED